MADFKIAYGITAINEGGYSNSPDDNGNWTSGVKDMGILVGTNLGVSAPVLMKYLGRIPTVNDMKNLSVETAQKIYKKNYWDMIRGDEIKSQAAGNSIYDSCVNMGVSRAIKLLQVVLLLPQTGIMDDKTLNKLNNK